MKAVSATAWFGSRWGSKTGTISQRLRTGARRRVQVSYSEQPSAMSSTVSAWVTMDARRCPSASKPRVKKPCATIGTTGESPVGKIAVPEMSGSRRETPETITAIALPILAVSEGTLRITPRKKFFTQGDHPEGCRGSTRAASAEPLRRRESACGARTERMNHRCQSGHRARSQQRTEQALAPFGACRPESIPARCPSRVAPAARREQGGST